MGKYKIMGIPSNATNNSNSNNPKLSLGANKGKNNVEAELGETVVTNMSRGENNYLEMYNIGGKKHYNGGTPLNLPTNNGDETKGSSFIFSDSKKMIVKDPNVLKYFGMDPKKPLTFAAISKSWVPEVNNAKAIIIDDDSDAISRKSAELTMSNASFKIAALQLLQESRKGFKQGVSDGLNPFFDKLQVDPNSLFSLDEKGADNMNKAVEAAFGGMISDYENNMPSFASLGGQSMYMKNGGSVLPIAAKGAAMKEQNLNDITVNYNKNDNTVAVTEDEIKAPTDPQPEWSQHKDPATGEMFYYNYLTKASSWTLPTDATFTAYTAPTTANVEPKSETKQSTDSEGAIWGPESAPKVQYDYIINKLATNDEFKDALYQEYLQAANQNLNFGQNYQSEADRKKVVRKSKEEVFNDYKKFQKRNLVFQSHNLDVQGTKQNVDKKDGKNRVSNNKLHEWATKYGVEFEDIDTATAEQLSFIAFENLVADKQTYSDKLQKVMSPFGSKPRGLDDETVMGPDGKPLKGRISKADGYYTNTTSGEVSWFTDPGPDPCPACPDGTVPVRLPDGTCPCPVITKDPGPCPPCPDGTIPVKLPDGSCPCEPNYKKLPDPRTIVNPYDFRKQDIAAVNRAKNALFAIPKIQPWGKVITTSTPDRAYYSPERAINARMSALNQQAKLQSNYSNAQGAGADFSNVAGKAYEDVANTISDYADKNVSIYTQGEQYDTALAKQNNDQVAGLANSMYDKTAVLKQNLANSISAAKDKILQLSSTAYSNAADIYNLNLTNENFKKDPYSGIVYKANDKPITPTSNTAEDFGKEFNAFQAKMPSVTGDLAMKAFLAYKSGKYTIATDDGVRSPNEVNNI
jgi:hypothetical protein